MTAPIPASVPGKLDPETFVLRAKPEPVVRFRKGLIVVLAGMVLTLLAGVSWFALSPGERGLPADETAKPAPRLQGLPDAVSGLPERYDEVPKLGPPLPGERQLIVADVESVQTSCGFAVPLYEYQEDRLILNEWAEKKGPAGVATYWAEKNQRSIDGLPTGLLS